MKSDWRDLDESGKKAWLLDCLDYSGTNPRLLDKNHFILQCNSIKHELDFYCLIGEVLCGKGGYLGQDLDGIQDCLSALRFEGRVLEIKSLDKLSKLLNTVNYNWTDRIVEILSSRFKVIIS